MKYLKKKKKSPLLPILLSLAVVLLIGLIVLALWLAGREQTPAEQTVPTEQTEPAVQTTSQEQTDAAEQTDPQEQTGAAEQTDPQEQTDPEKQTEPEETKQPEQQPQATEIPEETQLPDCEVETPYGTLYFPGQWEESMRAEVVMLDFGAEVVFYGTVTDEEYWLFTVHYGGADGIALGAIETEEGYYLDVTVEMSDFVPDESWSEENANLFSAMQESMNHLMEKLKADPAFQS